MSGAQGAPVTGSGSTDFNLTRNELICASLRVLGALKNNEEPNLYEYNNASQALNLMVKAWQGKGIGLWLNQRTYVFPGYGAEYVDLGPTGDKATHTYYETALSVAGEEDDTTITVDSDDNITSGDYIGIELDDGTMQWTTVNGTPSADVVTLTAALTGDAAIDSVVFTFTNLINRPMNILSAHYVDNDDYYAPMTVVGREAYFALNEKASVGQPNQAYYDPQMTNGRLYIWPTISDVTSHLELTVKVPIEDFDASTNTAHFPVEWLNALKQNLAIEIFDEYAGMMKDDGSPKYPHLNPNWYIKLEARADKALAQAEMFDSGGGSVFMAPDMRGAE